MSHNIQNTKHHQTSNMDMTILSNTKISVIIPIYNVAQYISKCIESLFSQSIAAGIEFIFVDDNSTDESISILNKIITDHKWLEPRINIIHHNKNRGLYQARISGVNQAKGEYIIFCDSDDWIDSTLYQDLYEKATRQNLDIVGCDFIREYDNGESKRITLYYSDSDLVIHKLLTGTPDCSGSVCTRLVRRELYLSCIRQTEQKLSMYEDLLTSVRLHLNTNKVGKVTSSCYHYRTYNGSMSSAINKTFVESSIIVAELIDTELSRANKHTIFLNDLENFKLRAKLPYIYYSHLYDPYKWKSLWPEITSYNYPDILPYLSIQLEKKGWSKFNLLFIKFRETIKNIIVNICRTINI